LKEDVRRGVGRGGQLFWVMTLTEHKQTENLKKVQKRRKGRRKWQHMEKSEGVLSDGGAKKRQLGQGMNLCLDKKNK